MCSNNTLKKAERISHKKDIDRLFSKGKSFPAFPLLVIYLSELCETKPDSDISILVSVSKKKFKRAVDRNRVKRLVREAYRLNKQCLGNLQDSVSLQLRIAFLYTHKEILPFHEIEKGMKKALVNLKEELP